MTTHPRQRLLHAARMSCAALGRADAIASRRQAYHSQTIAGLRSNASAVARSSERKLRHSPSAPLKVGTPLAADTPAPVSTVTRRARLSRSANRISLGSLDGTGTQGKSVDVAGQLRILAGDRRTAGR